MQEFVSRRQPRLSGFGLFPVAGGYIGVPAQTELET